MKILLIVPCYNEQDIILKTCNIIKANNFDYIVINDGSTDNSEKILNDNNIPHIKLIHNLGIGGAVQTGYKYALKHNYDIAIQFDGDGQHDIDYINNLINPIINKKANFVIGSRFIEKMDDNFQSTKARRMGINLISFFIKLFTGSKITDPTSGFRAADKKVITLFANSYPFEYPEPSSTVELLKRKLKVEEVSVRMFERTKGKSSIGSWKNIYYMFNVILSIFIVSIRRYK